MFPTRTIVVPLILPQDYMPVVSRPRNNRPRNEVGAGYLGDWTLTDPKGQPHLIDGTARLAANNPQMLLAGRRTLGLAANRYASLYS
jgi:hypothetical protein